MSQAVSLGISRHSSQKEELPKTAFAQRVSFKVNCQQALAICLIVMAIFMPLAVAVAAPAMPRINTQSHLMPEINATCPLLPISPVALASYLQAGNGGQHTSATGLKSSRLKPEDFKLERWDSPSLLQYRVEKTQFELLQKAADEYVLQAEKADHPAARALAFHQARESLSQADTLARNRWDVRLDSKIAELRIKEAEACQEAAEEAETPEEKLQWIARGLQELKIPLRLHGSGACVDLNRDGPKCDAAASLWHTAADVFLKLPSGEHHHPSIVNPEHWGAPFSETRFAAAECLRNTAWCATLSKDFQEAQDLYDEALAIMKKIDAHAYPLDVQVNLQDEVVRTCFLTLRIRQLLEKEEEKPLAARAFSETMILQKLYQHLTVEKPHMASYSIIQRAARLFDAAHLTSNLTQSVELLREARDIVQQAWDQDPNGCLSSKDFTYGYFSLDHSLLGQLKRAAQEAEKALHLSKPSTTLAAAWNKIRNWLGRKSTP